MRALEACAVTRIREEQVEPAHGHTLNWLLTTGTGPDSPRFLEWCSKQWGVFWIQGRPGSGKSTAMKFLLHHPRVVESLDTGAEVASWKLAGVFFTDRLGSIERSWKAVLASMLYQLVSEDPLLSRVIVPLGKRGKSKNVETLQLNEMMMTEEVLYEWDITTLQKALLFCKNQQRIRFKICYFIDALDENNEEECSRRNAMEFLLKLASASTDTGYGTIKICTASRPENDLSELLSSKNGLKIHEWTRSDVETYVRDKLGQHPPMKTLILSSNESIRQRSNDLMMKIVDKAQGVFLWVRLIVDDLRDSLTDGLALGIDDLEERLGQTPEELQAFYALVLQRVPPKLRQESYTIFGCVLQAQRPLTLSDLWLILESRKHNLSQGSAKSSVFYSDDKISTILDSGSGLERRVKACSGGLLEVRIQLKRQYDRWSDNFEDIDDDHSISAKRPQSESNDRGHQDDRPKGREFSNLDHGLHQADMRVSTVQVLHQTVREFLSQSSSLLSLLSLEQERLISIIVEENVHFTFLRSFLFWLRIPKIHRQTSLSSRGPYVKR